MRSDRRYPQSKPETASCSARLLDRSACELKASHERPLWRRHPGGSRQTDAQEPIPCEKHTRSLQKRACYFTEDTKADLSNRGLPVLECVSIWVFFFFPRFTERLSPAQRTSAGVCAVRPAGAGPPRAAAAQTAVDLGFCVLA